MRNIITLATSLLVLTVLAVPVMAKSSVTVKLWDNGETLDLSKNMGMDPGSTMDMSKAPMSIKIQPAVVPAGRVIFKVTNNSKAVIHEMLVAPISKADAALPYVEAENRADENKAGDLGEVSELDPGKSGELSIDMKPGIYVLFCNVPGHLGAGMWTTLTVK